jgi:hypothetical protein
MLSTAPGTDLIHKVAPFSGASFAVRELAVPSPPACWPVTIGAPSGPTTIDHAASS